MRYSMAATKVPRRIPMTQVVSSSLPNKRSLNDRACNDNGEVGETLAVSVLQAKRTIDPYVALVAIYEPLIKKAEPEYAHHEEILIGQMPKTKELVNRQRKFEAVMQDITSVAMHAKRQRILDIVNIDSTVSDPIIEEFEAECALLRQEEELCESDDDEDIRAIEEELGDRSISILENSVLLTKPLTIECCRLEKSDDADAYFRALERDVGSTETIRARDHLNTVSVASTSKTTSVTTASKTFSNEIIANPAKSIIDHLLEQPIPRGACGGRRKETPKCIYCSTVLQQKRNFMRHLKGCLLNPNRHLING